MSNIQSNSDLVTIVSVKNLGKIRLAVAEIFHFAGFEVVFSGRLPLELVFFDASIHFHFSFIGGHLYLKHL
jgi:hypothetical protein